MRVHRDPEPEGHAALAAARTRPTGRPAHHVDGWDVRTLQRSIGNRSLSRLLAAGLPPVPVQRSSIVDFGDGTKWQNDPAKVTDGTLRGTTEYGHLDGAFGTGWQVPMRSYSDDQLLLGLRLILRDVHERGVAVPTGKDALIGFSVPYLERAVAQGGAATSATQLAGKPTWTPLGPPDFAGPGTSKSDIVRWLLDPKAPAPTDTSTMNCWELVMYSAFRGGFTTKAHLQAVYRSAATKSGLGVPAEIEARLCGPRRVLDLADPTSAEPLPGDVVIFNEFANHVAISLGTKTPGGAHQVMSLWSVPASSGGKAARTTIEALAGALGLTKVAFCSARWQ